MQCSSSNRFTFWPYAHFWCLSPFFVPHSEVRVRLCNPGHVCCLVLNAVPCVRNTCCPVAISGDLVPVLNRTLKGLSYGLRTKRCSYVPLAYFYVVFRQSLQRSETRLGSRFAVSRHVSLVLHEIGTVSRHVSLVLFGVGNGSSPPIVKWKDSVFR